MYEFVDVIDSQPLIERLTPLFPKPFGDHEWESGGYLLNPLVGDDWDFAKAYLAETIPGEWFRAKLISIKPNGVIHIHEDPRPADWPDTQRYHVVLVSNAYAFSYHEGAIQQLMPGGVYRIDEHKTHAAVNWGKTPRVHLVIDVLT